MTNQSKRLYSNTLNKLGSTVIHERWIYSKLVSMTWRYLMIYVCKVQMKYYY